MAEALPTLRTERLELRAPTRADAPAIARVNGDIDVARGTMTYAHPYNEAHAVEWIETFERDVGEGVSAQWVMALASTGELVGSIGLRLTPEHERGLLGYVVGKAHWGAGYATEAVRGVVAYGFNELGLERIEATHWEWNEASGRVLAKAGFRVEGVMRRRFRRFGEWRDEVCLAMLREEFEAMEAER